MSRVTGLVKELKPNEIFVFGSNESGIHGKGAAKQAKLWGAKNGIGVGLSGQTYGIPTKDKRIKTLSLTRIRQYVYDFERFAIEHPELTFLVTSIGCGLAGYRSKDIAPMFVNIYKTCPNVYLPKEFINLIENIQRI